MSHDHAHTHTSVQEYSVNEADSRQAAVAEISGPIITIRSHTGISGDIFIAGLGSLALQELGIAPESEEAARWLAQISESVMPDQECRLGLKRQMVNGIGGWKAEIILPDTQPHRHLADIRDIIGQSGLSEDARAFSLKCFGLLASCEGEVHGIKAEDVHFHEVGALDSILDICITCEIYVRLGRPRIIASPLPVADGSIHCAHGLMPAPAPAVLNMLRGIPVRAFSGCSEAGELVTPTGLALLKALGAEFGSWPEMIVQNTTIAYGSKQFKDTPNGVILVLGRPFSARSEFAIRFSDDCLQNQ